MGNTNSSHRLRSRSPDQVIESAWNNSYPRSNKMRPQPDMENNHRHRMRNSGSAAYDQFDQECTQQDASDRFLRYGPSGAQSLEVVQPQKKIKVLPTANGAVKQLRPTDNGIALHKVGTLHIANRKMTELQLDVVDGLSMSDAGLSDGDTRSPTPDYPSSKRGSRPRSKKKSKAPTAPSTPAASMKSGDHGDSKRSSSKLRLFKAKSSEAKDAMSESQRMKARSMEYLRADLADETQEVRRKRSSREDLSGDESLLAVTKTGPITVFSSQKKLDQDDWEEMPRIRPNKQQQPEQEAQPRQFYFGMTPGDVAVATVPQQNLDLDEESRRVMEEFDAVLSDSRTKSEVSEDKDAAKRRRGKNRRRPSPPPIYAARQQSNTDDVDEDDEGQDIALSLRPTLPKKPQQLPRFSPSAAWRALGGHQANADSYGRKLDSSKASDMSAMDLSDEEDDDDVMEERINKNSLRPVAPHPPRNINEKSADSGISGDAGSPDAAIKPLAMSSPVPQQQQQQQQQQSWTPQQDLLDDDSSDQEASQRPTCLPKSSKHDPSVPKIIPKSQMFNDSTELSTPGSSVSGRHGRGRKYRKRNENNPVGDAPQKYNSLRKLKRSVSGAIASAFRRSKSPAGDDESGGSIADIDGGGGGNWVLSRSAPNSIINGSVGESSLRRFVAHRSEADLLHHQQLMGSRGSGLNGGLMLAHQYPAYSQPSVLTQRIVYLPQYDSRAAVKQQQHQQRGRQPIDRQSEMMRRAKSADAVYLEAEGNAGGLVQRRPSSGATKKFTFQSTVRVQEKRLLEAKLSREAELKERKRLQEMQAMQRVEEEFQRKRAREKANIRQQLRVLQYSSSGDQQQSDARLDPEGAPSSISHQRTSSDELQQQQQPPASKQQQSKVIKQVRSPPTKREILPAVLKESRRPKPTEIPPPDYRREAINSSKTRSAAPPPPSASSSKPSANGQHQAQQPAGKKAPTNIYRRLAEITSEEESISSPPSVPHHLLVTSSPARANLAGKQQQHSRHSHQPSVTTLAASTSASANAKVMTQELSEYRQERREYRDYRSPRLHQPPQPQGLQYLASPPGRYVPQTAGQRLMQAAPPSSVSVSTSVANKMQSDNYRWDFAHGGRSGKSGPYSHPPPPPVWHPIHPVPQHPAAVVRHHDYHHFYKMTSPSDVIMMHRTQPQRHHH